MPNSNTFKIMFWVMATICFGGILILTSNVVANDKLSRTRDTDINRDITDEIAKVRQESHEADISIKECMQKMQVEIVQRLTRIETKIESLQ